MEKEVFVADDRGKFVLISPKELTIPDYIKNMTSEELDAEIARLEAKVIAKKQQRLQAEKKAS